MIRFFNLVSNLTFLIFAIFCIFLLKTLFVLLVCAVILHLALCWKHDLKNSFLRQTSKKMILPYVPCGHFALSTLSETCFKDAVFEVNVRHKKYRKFSKSQNVNFDTKIKNRIIFRYYFV